MEKEISARATATVTITFPVSGGGWGDGCTLDQVYKQAAETAEGQVRNAFKPESFVRITSLTIDAVIAERKAK